MRIGRVFAVAACGLVWLGLAPGAGADACRGIAPAGTSEDYLTPGPHPVGVQTFVFVDDSRPTAPNGGFPGAPERILRTEVWYPALAAGRDADPDLAGGPYPVVVHSHGFLDSRIGQDYLTRHLASRGFVVAAPDYPLSVGNAPGGPTTSDVANQPGDWSFVLDGVLAELPDLVDPERIGASGLSLGGLTTSLVTYHRDLRDPRIDAAMSIAGVACPFTPQFYATTDAPLLILHGNSDQLIPFRKNAFAAYRGSPPSSVLVELDQASHTGFSRFATIFDPSVHYDVIGCIAIAGGIESDSNPFEGFDDPETGVEATPERCPLPCSEPFGGASMDAVRQSRLTRIAGAAFFAAELQADSGAACFLRSELDRENPDVSVRSD